MERLKKLRRVVILLVVLFAVNLLVLAFMLSSYTPLTIAVILVQIVVVVYFTALCMGLIKEVGKHEQEKEK